MSFRVLVDRDLCQGHGVCESEAPELFVVGEDRSVVVLLDMPEDSQREAAAQAARYCPTHALSLLET